MDWLRICTDNYNSGYYNATTLKVFVVKNKITAAQYKEITDIEYVA